MSENTIEFNIESLAYGGEGVARQDGKVYFVAGALPGERVSARVTEEKKNFARAEAVQILEPSASRVSPLCEYYGRCGGCQLQHLRYEDQLEWKHRWLEELLVRIGKLKLDGIIIDPVIASPKPYGYRNRVGLTLLHGEKRKVRQGFMSGDNKSLVDIGSCQIAMPNLNQAIGDMEAKNKFGSFFGDFRNKLKVEIATDGERTFFLPWQSFAEKSGLGEKPEEGKILKKKIGGLEFEFSPQVFFQTNFYLLERLVARVSELAAAATSVFDLYSGVGLFAASLASEGRKVIAVEENRLAHRFTLRNLERNNLKSVLAYAGRAEVKFPNLFDQHKSEKNVILVDPPRGGLEASFIPVLAGVREKIDSLIYLSCEPAILARDLARFSEAGFRIERITPFDFFPQTQIFETVVVLRGA